MANISVVVSNYNAGKEGILKALMDSWCMQSVEATEYIVVDHNSSDNSVDVAMSYADRLPIRVVRKNDKLGRAPLTIGYGVDRCIGDIVIIGHSDKIVRRDYIKVMTANLAGNEWRIPGECYVGYDDVDAVLNTNVDNRWDYAHSVRMQARHLKDGLHLRAAWTASFHKSNWNSGHLTDKREYGPDDAFYQSSLSNRGNVTRVEECLCIHLQHTRTCDKYYRHPTKTWRDK